MNVSIPDPMKSWCEGQVAHGRYATTSDYVRDLIRQDQDRQQDVTLLQTAIDEGLRSGVSPQTLEQLLRQVRLTHGGEFHPARGCLSPIA